MFRLSFGSLLCIMFGVKFTEVVTRKSLRSREIGSCREGMTTRTN